MNWNNWTKTINLMLDRIEKSFKKNMQFTSDASHELRTPITGLKAGTEVILSKERSAEEYRELHENNLIVFEGLTQGNCIKNTKLIRLVLCKDNYYPILPTSVYF